MFGISGLISLSSFSLLFIVRATSVPARPEAGRKENASPLVLEGKVLSKRSWRQPVPGYRLAP